MIGKGICDKGFIRNLFNCECDKSCDEGEYLDYKNYKCRKKIVDKLLEECSENIDGNEITVNAVPLNDYGKVCNSCTIYIVFLAIFLIMSISISSAFVYFHWYLKKKILRQQFIECNSIKHINNNFQKN